MNYKNIYLVLVVVAMSSCSKKEDVDPRDQYVGTYAVTINATQKVIATGVTTPATASATLPFVKGNASDEMTITDTFGTHTIKLSGSNFTVQPYTVPGSVNGSSVNFTISGSGSFSGKSLNMTTTSTGGGLVVLAVYTGSRP